MGEVAPDLIRKATIQRLRPLLLGGYIEAGYSPYQKGQFESWSVEGDVAVERIDLEWKKLGKDPNIWEVCWFKNTEKGNALARALQE